MPQIITEGGGAGCCAGQLLSHHILRTLSLSPATQLDDHSARLLTALQGYESVTVEMAGRGGHSSMPPIDKKGKGLQVRCALS